jgi:hypothetical protein
MKSKENDVRVSPLDGYNEGFFHIPLKRKYENLDIMGSGQAGIRPYA